MRKLLISAVAALTLAACGGSGGSSSGNNGFTITSITPANNSQITVTQAFVANFNNQLDPNTIGNVTLATESGAQVLINCASASSTSIICTPTTTLSYGTNYNLTYGSGIHNAAGNSLNQTIYNYQTYANSGVASVVPSSGAISPNNTTWSFQFNESMNLATLNTSQTPGNVLFYQESGSQALAGKFHTTTATTGTSLPIVCTSTDPTAMTCTLQGMTQLPLNESYTLLLTNKIVSANNVPITPQALNYQSSAYTQPTVTANPVAGAVGLNQLSYVLTFNTTMQPSTVNSHVVMTDTTSSSTINTNCTSSDNTVFTCSLQSMSQLAPNHNYTLALESGILSTQNIGLVPTSFGYSATNYTQPAINFITPPSGAVSLDQLNYNIQFNTAMDMSTFSGNVTFVDTTTTNAVTINCTSNDNINVLCSLSGISQLTPGDNYTLSFGSGIKSAQQVPIVSTAYSYAATNYTVPTIQYVNPTAGAIGLTQTVYTAKFNTPMNMSTFSGNVTFRDTTAGSNLTIVCTSSDNVNVQCALQGVSQLTYNHNYTLTFGSGIQSQQSVAITQSSYNYAATVFTTPHIVSITPTPGAISLTQLTFTPQFNESMNMSTFTSNNVNMTDTTSGTEIAVSCASTDKITVICTLSGISQLTYNHNYALNFGAGITSNLGVPISPTTYNYSATNATVPQVSSISPVNGATIGISGVNFLATFNTAMSTATFTNANIKLYDNTASGWVSMNCSASSSTVASCTPTANLSPYHSYTLTLTNAITSALGVPMNQVSYSYTSNNVTYNFNTSGLSSSQIHYSLNNNLGYVYSTGITLPDSGTHSASVYQYINNNWSGVAQFANIGYNNGASFVTNGTNSYFVTNAHVYQFVSNLWTEITGNSGLNTNSLSGYLLSQTAAIFNNTVYVSGITNPYYENLMQYTGSTNWNGVTPSGVIDGKTYFYQAPIYQYNGNLYIAGSLYGDGNLVGISKFNGSGWTSVTNNLIDNISNPYGISLQVTSKGIYVLLNSPSNQLWFWNGNNWTNLLATGGFVNDGTVSSFFADENGNVFVGTTKGAVTNHVFMYKFSTGAWSTLANLDQYTIDSISSDTAGNIVAVSSSYPTTSIVYVGKPQ